MIIASSRHQFANQTPDADLFPTPASYADLLLADSISIVNAILPPSLGPIPDFSVEPRPHESSAPLDSFTFFSCPPVPIGCYEFIAA
jgi:hypothetical protein